ncbi:MAG TPA: helix-turn-helix transcriptional regulator [Bacilli bacterium]|uniref:PadR family transcriptional regulator n=1 Tax=Amphibacillus indicireducens TaxID=1076330 RepID=A0ABP7V0I3_9BACI|nr:helix-turn-helix transcriptional regulator [Bacilli bacterium]
MISSDIMRGYNDILILQILKEHDSYGYEISKKITVRSEGHYEIKEATLYAALIRLQDKKYIESYSGNVSQGKPRTYYKLTHLGRSYLQEKFQEWQTTKKVLDNFIEE